MIWVYSVDKVCQIIDVFNPIIYGIYLFAVVMMLLQLLTDNSTRLMYV